MCARFAGFGGEGVAQDSLAHFRVTAVNEGTVEIAAAGGITRFYEIKVRTFGCKEGGCASLGLGGFHGGGQCFRDSFNLLARNGVKIEGNTVTQNGEPLFKIHRRHAARKTQGCYRELMPTLEYVKQEQKQEKPSIRDQLRTAAKQQPEKKSPVKSKTHDMEL